MNKITLHLQELVDMNTKCVGCLHIHVEEKGQLTCFICDSSVAMSVLALKFIFEFRWSGKRKVHNHFYVPNGVEITGMYRKILDMQ